jgi:histidinol-phosphatase (PHP family)
MIYGTDYHVHTTYSDGQRDPEAYIEAALKLGLREIGFSDHLNPAGGPPDWCMPHDRLPQYAEHVLRLKKDHKDIAVRLGLEIDYLPGTEEVTDRIINSFPSIWFARLPPPAFST